MVYVHRCLRALDLLFAMGNATAFGFFLVHSIRTEFIERLINWSEFVSLTLPFGSILRCSAL